MAKKTRVVASSAKSTPAPSQVMVAMDKTGPGDPVVLVKLHGSTRYQPCYARDRKARQIIVDGLPCEHVGEAPDGTWLYEQRVW